MRSLFGIAVLILCACGGVVPQPPAKTVVTAQPRPEKKTVPSYPASIRKNDVEVVPVSLAIGKVPLKGAIGVAESENAALILTVRVVNRSETKRIDFKGWPANQFIVNCGTKDEHGNAYKVVVFFQPIIGDEKGPAIDPGKEGKAIIPFEKPIDAAGTITITLKGDAVGMDGETFEWKAVKSDWR